MSVQRQWTLWLIGGVLGALVGAVAIYALRIYLDVGWLGSVVCLLLFMSLGDLLLVWDNHRAEKAGEVHFWNRPTAETATVVHRFTPVSDSLYRGKVGFDGEIWSAVSRQMLDRDEPVRIRRRRGLHLRVERMDNGSAPVAADDE